jgi:hypothetical protein
MIKKKNNFKGNRILKNDPMEIKPGNLQLNPLTLMLHENDSENIVYFSKFHFNNNELSTITNDKNLKLSNNNSMSTPPILIPQNEFLKIHNINNIADLIQYIDDNIDNLVDYNNRLINCFIRYNYKDLKKNNKILANIYLKLFKNYKTDIKEINTFVKNWFKNNNSDYFFLNLGNDLKNYLSNKYES